MKYRSFLIALAVGLTTTASAQGTQFRQVFASDSIIPFFAQTSPDGKWIVMVRTDGFRSGSLWIAPVGSSTAMRLTSDGYNDAQPAWFSSGDRIVFLSTRPNRNGGNQQYLMTIGVNPATGQAVGAPRQVTSEPVQTRARPSADGRWILYVTPGEPATLKIVPSNGGSARTVAQGRHPMMGLSVSPDGRHAYYTQQAGAGGGPCRPVTCQTYTLKRVAVDGGAPVDVATASHPIRAHPPDPRYVQHQVSGAASGTLIFELRDSTDRALGRIEFPSGVRQTAFTGDGWGVVGIGDENERSIRVVPVAGGAARTVTKGDRRWPEAWMADGSALITDRVENGRIVIEVTALDGTPLRQYTLPAGAQRSGWASSVGPWFSYFAGPQGLSALNVVTGQMKRIANAASGSFGGRGGMEQDGSRWGVVEHAGGQSIYTSVDPATGATTALRTVPSGNGNRRYFTAHGSRLAWLEARGDSLDLMIAENPTAPARRIISAKASIEGADESLAWSWKGDRIAVCSGAAGADRALTILTVTTTATVPVTRQDVPIGNSVGCWAPQWLPDESGLLFLTIIDRQREDVPDLAYLSLQPGAQVRVLTKDDPYEIWSYLTSPDGRYAAYPVDLPVSRASIHVASFKGLIEARR
jgi:Tol biopolymer transport system component